MGSKRLNDPPTRKTNRQHRLDNVPTHIYTPRTYQVELLDKALQRNTIVCLNTEAGKTFIISMLVKELAHELDKPLDQGGKRTFVIVDKVTDVAVNAELLVQHNALSVREYTRQMDCFGRKEWTDSIENKQVHVLPAMTFLYLLEDGVVNMSQINLLLIEDCHLAVNTSHPYAKIMQFYHSKPPMPRVVALTVSVLNEQCKTPQELEETLAQLESIFHSTAETSTDNLVADVYSAKPAELIIDCDEYVDITGLVEIFGGILTESIDFLNDVNIPYEEEEGEVHIIKTPKTALQECLYVLDSLGPWCCGKVAGVLAKQVMKILQFEADETAKRFLQYSLTQLSLIDHIMNQIFENKIADIEEFYDYMSPKVRELIEILHGYKPDDNFMIIGSDGIDFPSAIAPGIDDDDDDDEEEEDDSDEEDLQDDDDDDDDPQFSDDQQFQEDGLKKANIKEIKDAQKSNTEKENKDRKEEKQEHSSSVHYVAMRKTEGSGEDPSSEQPKDTSICGIVFLQRRHVAFVLNKLLVEMCNWDPDLFFIRSHTITDKPGTKKRNGQTDSAQFKKQEEVLRKFRQKEFNLLIGTNVLEEGVDVPRCNLIVRFDLPTDYRSYVQSKGRCRAADSKFYMLVDRAHKEQFLQQLETLRGFEKILLEKHEQQDIEEVEVEGWDRSSVDALLPSYTSSTDPDMMPHAPQLTMSNAINMVNKYCAKLPSDAFTHLTPKCTLEEEEDGEMYRATLQLPINSTIKQPIVGEWMQKRKFAKMAVALKTCQKLFEEGELDKNFLPIGKEMIRYEDEEHEWEETEASGQACPGTTKRKQYYEKRIACPLLDAPQPADTDATVVEGSCWLYRCDMRLRRPVSVEQNPRGRRIHAPDETPRHFGLITRHRMPLVPEFPVFTRSGEVSVRLEMVSGSVRYTQEQLQRLYNFQKDIFAKVLRLVKDPMQFDPENAESSFVVAPLTITDSAAIDVDWPFIDMVEVEMKKLEEKQQKVQKIKQLSVGKDLGRRDMRRKEVTTSKESEKKVAKNEEELTNGIKEASSKEFVFCEEDFEDAVVMPSYRNTDQPQYFYVAEIRTDLTPRSQFPSPELYDTFAAYYTSKYQLEITALHQPLLDVDHTSARLNLLTPRYMNQKGVALPTSSAETRRARQETLQQKQILIPELCDIHPFPASLWRKAVCMPAILYRINYLLVADELRKRIATEAGIGVADLDEDLRFPELEFGFSTCPEDNSQQSQQSLTKEGKECIHENGDIGDDSSVAVMSPDEETDSHKMPQRTEDLNHKLLIEDLSDSEEEEEEEEDEDEIEDPPDVNPLVTFDDEPDLATFVGPSPCIILQTLTMSNANDFFNLERLETIGDSFLKFAITVYLYCNYPGIHEGKLSYLRSKQVSNYNLYKLGKKKQLPECMVAAKFEPTENWLPPAFKISKDTHGLSVSTNGKAPSTDEEEPNNCVLEEANGDKTSSEKNKDEKVVILNDSNCLMSKEEEFNLELEACSEMDESSDPKEEFQKLIPYNLQTQHSLPDKSIADCVEALIGCYLTVCGQRAALQFMSWMGLRVMLNEENDEARNEPRKSVRKTAAAQATTLSHASCFGLFESTPSPLLTHISNATCALDQFLHGYDAFERKIHYKFRDRSYLLQAFTHASYHYNTVTDCYQRLEFLGDAILDYVITRHLFEDIKKHSPGILTDLRSALVNNNIFAALAVKWEFHKYFKAVSPQLFEVIDKFVNWQKEQSDQILLEEEMDVNCDEEEDKEEEKEDIEIPKALGDIFESVAGAIYLDSGMSLDSVWKVYYRMMKPQIDAFTEKIPKSPVRELLEMEPETAKFERPERTLGGKIRVSVTVVGKGTFKGVGRNYRIAKSAAAKRALKYMRLCQLEQQKYAEMTMKAMSGDFQL